MFKRYFMVIALCLLLPASLVQAQEEAMEEQEFQMTGDECIEMDGMVVNTAEDGHCGDDEIELGEVTDMRCPCVCCVKIDYGEEPEMYDSMMDDETTMDEGMTEEEPVMDEEVKDAQ